MKKLGKGCLIVIGVLFGLLVLLIIIGMVNSGNPSTEKPPKAVGTNTKVSETKTTDGNLSSNNNPTKLPEVEPTKKTETKNEKPTQTLVHLPDNGFTFEDICNNSTTAGNTELEWDTFKKKVINTHFVDREAELEDVTQGLLGGYSLVLNPGQSYNGCGLKIYIETTKEEGLKYTKGQKIAFSGKIDSIDQFLSDVLINLGEAEVTYGPENVNIDEIQIGSIGSPQQCGNSFMVTVLEPPELSKGMGYGDRAVGTYFIVKLEITNTGAKTFDGFDKDYFKLQGILNDKPVEFSSDWDASWYAAKRKFGFKFLSDEIPPGLPWKTQVAFDINPEAKDLVFLFVPKDSLFDSNNLCEVRIGVPYE